MPVSVNAGGKGGGIVMKKEKVKKIIDVSVLVVAAHPDDEVLGCGGTIMNHTARGELVHILFLSDGVMSRDGAGDADVRARRNAAKMAANILGADVEFADFPDNRFDEVCLLDIARRIEKTKSRIRPSLVYTHHGGDLNIDHQRTCQAVVTAFRPQPSELCSELYFFEVSSSTEWQFSLGVAEFRPQVAVDIAAYWEKKVAAMDCYETELRPPPHPRSIHSTKALAAHRGSTFGMTLAETFEVGYIRKKEQETVLL